RTKWRLRPMIRNNAASNNCARPPHVAERKTVSWEPGLRWRLIPAGQNESKKFRNMLCMRCWCEEITCDRGPGQQNWLQRPTESSPHGLDILSSLGLRGWGGKFVKKR